MPNRRFSPSLDALEQRLALSTLATLTTPEYRLAKAEIRHALAGNVGDAAAELTEAASLVPFGRADLLPLWEAQLSAVSTGTPRAVVGREILHSLDAHLRLGVEAGALTVRGPAARRISPPGAQSINGYVIFENLTNRDLSVTLTRIDRVIFEARLDPGTVAHLRLPPAELLHRDTFEVAVTAVGGSPHRFEALSLAGSTVVALNGPVPGEIELRVFRSEF